MATAKELAIEFDEGGITSFPYNTDKNIEEIRNIVEKEIGHKLPVDPKTDFPSFTIYEDGEAIGGG